MQQTMSDRERQWRLYEAYSYLIALSQQKRPDVSATGDSHVETASDDTPSKEVGDAVRE